MFGDIFGFDIDRKLSLIISYFSSFFLLAFLNGLISAWSASLQ